MGWLVLSLILAARAEAATYYISPSGADAPAGGTATAPWRTFAYALDSSRASCGDTLNLLDGVYGDGTGTGKISLSGRVCTASAKLVIRCLNSRKCRINDNGTGDAIYLNSGTAHITFEGIIANSANANQSGGRPFHANNTSSIIIRDSLFYHPNQQGNGVAALPSVVGFIDSLDGLVEDTECYDYSHHCVNFFASQRMTARRVYGHTRGGQGGAGVAMYPCRECIVENVIVEGHGWITEMNATNNTFTHGPILLTDSKVLGSVCSGCNFGNGIYMTSRNVPDANHSPQNIAIRDVAFVNYTSPSAAIRDSDGINVTIDHVTVEGAGDVGVGIGLDDAANGVSGPQMSATIRNTIVTNRSIGFYIEPNVGITNFSGSNNRSFSNTTPFNPSLPSNWGASSNTSDPQLGACKVWIPSGSPMKGAGTGGSDIGANILYRYQNGVLTNQPLWDPTTGKFPCGVIVPGVNDVAGSSCRDVHTRLNVNTNGCPFPAGYGGSTPPPAFSFSLSNGGAKSVTRGAAITNTVTATLVSGTAQSTAFSVAGLPSGVTASFSATSCSPTCSTTLTLNASALATIGVSTLTVTAVGGGISRTTSFGLTVNAPPAAGSGPIAHWRLDENTGTTATDAAGGDNNGTLTNGPLWTAGRIGSALSFDGINDSVSVPDSPALDLTGALTLSAWVNPAIATTSYKSIMIKNYTYFMYASAPGCGNGGILAGLSGTPARVVCDTTPLAVNTWTHLAVTYDGAAVRLYRNGVLKSSAAVTGGPTVTAGTLQLGASQYGEHFKGKLDEARVYNRALSAAEVLALVNAAPTGIVTDLNGDGVTNVTDVQMAINQASGAAACSSGDVNKDGACNVADVQLVINRALGL